MKYSFVLEQFCGVENYTVRENITGVWSEGQK